MPLKRILYISLNPIQNAKPYRLMQKEDGISQTVIYLEKADAGLFSGKENINKSAFDNDMLSGYNAKFWPRKRLFGARHGFFSFASFDIYKAVKKTDIVVIYGHHYCTFWIAMIAAKVFRKKIILTTDATYLEANDESKGFKLKVKPLLLKFLYNIWANAVFVPSTASKLFLESVGIFSKKIIITPYVVDEDLIETVSSNTNIEQFRTKLGYNITDIIFVFCAKFIDRKRPLDAIEALAKLNNPKVKLIMIGEGPLKNKLQERVNELNITNQVTFSGIVKYTQLPSFYKASDCLVFCSDHEPYGLPVNEAMLCGKPVILSDRIGARLDLVEEGKTGWIYKAGDVDELANKMHQFVTTSKSNTFFEFEQLTKLKMKNWSSQTNVNNQLAYFKQQNWLK